MNIAAQLFIAACALGIASAFLMALSEATTRIAQNEWFIFAFMVVAVWAQPNYF
jgi:hypothetical protein